MNKNNELASLLGEVPALTQNAEGQLRGGFTAFKGDDGIELYNSDGACASNFHCNKNDVCSNNKYCFDNGECYNQDNTPAGGTTKPTGR